LSLNPETRQNLQQMRSFSLCCSLFFVSAVCVLPALCKIELLHSAQSGNTSNTGGSGCSNYTQCDQCTQENSCIWCQSAQSCADGDFYGPSGSCDDWQWKQCSANGKYLLIGVAGGIGLIVLCLFVCICCCCCRQRRKSKKQQFKDYNEFKALNGHHSINGEETESLISKHPPKQINGDRRWRRNMV